jgi:hypothetical protein
LKTLLDQRIIARIQGMVDPVLIDHAGNSLKALGLVDLAVVFQPGASSEDVR